MNPFIKYLPLFGQTFIVLLTFWVALFLAWQSLSAVDFAYPLIYDALDIGAVIQTYAPLNLYKSGFEVTSQTQHIALFGQIVESINQGGENLSKLIYSDSKGQVIDTLLRTPEIVHLQDVANLLDQLRLFSYWAVALLLLLLGIFKQTKTPLNHLIRSLWLMLAMIGGGIIFVWLFGAEDIFYTLHTWVFPDNHQWFFYYQESLMTTLMKAPDIFGVIAVLLVTLAFVYFGLVLGLIKMLLKEAPYERVKK